LGEKICRKTGSNGSGGGACSIAVFLVCLVVAAGVVLAAHWPALSSKALSFDDEQYLLENKLVKNPGLKSTERFLSEVLYPSSVRGYYQPLAMISLMTDYAMGGRADNLTPFRITSLALHIANTILIIVLLYQLFGNFWAAAAAGLLFGVHPITIESIAWLSERKTVLSAFFVLWSLICYIRFSRTGSKKIYAFCIGFFILALLSKPTATPLPILMLLLDYWPLARLSKKGVVEKIPFLLVSFVSAIITFLSQRNTAEVIMPSQHGPLYIPYIITHNIIFYLYKFVWPVRLSAFYPFPSPFTIGHPMILAGVTGTIILFIAMVISLRWTKALVMGWLFFFLAVFPTLGIIGFHPVIAADRHAYLPMVGFLLPVAAGLSILFRNSYKGCIIGSALLVMVYSTEIFGVRGYLVNWRDTVTHYKYMLSLTPNHEVLHNNLALALAGLGKTDEAIEQYSRSLQLKENHEVHNNIGNALQKKGQIDEAIVHYRRAIELTENRKLRWNQPPGFAEAHYNLAAALRIKGQFAEAVQHYRKVLELKPDDVDALRGLGTTLAKLKEFDKAIECYNKALEIEPDNVFVHGQLSLALAGAGRIDEAIKEIRFVLKIMPDDVEMYRNLGILLEGKGETAEAIKSYQAGLQIDPNAANVRQLLEALQKQRNQSQPEAAN